MGKLPGFALMLCLLVCGCHRDDKPKDGAPAPGVTVKVVGATTISPLVSELAASFHARNPGIHIVVEEGGSTRGIEDTRAGRSDIGMVARALSDEERDLAGFSIARDGVCLIVNGDNPVNAITTVRGTDVLSGRVTSWRELGGTDARIDVITRPERRGALDLVSRHFGLRPQDIKAGSMAVDNDHAIKDVAADPNAITIVSIGEVERRAAAGVAIKPLILDGIAATSENVRNGRYPLARSLTLVTRTLPTGPTKAFVDFALSPDAAPVIRKYGFVAYIE